MTDYTLYPYNHVVNGLYIGGWHAVEQAQAIASEGIHYILKLYRDEPYFPPPFHTLDLPLADGEYIPSPVLERGTQFILQHNRGDDKILVMCSAGISRSSTFVLSALVAQGYQLPDAFRLLRQARPIVEPHPALWLSLIEHYRLPYTMQDVGQWVCG